MARGKDDSGEELNLQDVLDAISSTKIKKRIEGIKNLTAIFIPSSAANLDVLDDKTYHRIVETVFPYTISEKHEYLTANTSTSRNTHRNRLLACAEALKAVVRAGAARFKPRTIKAVAVHVVDTLTLTDGSLFEPITQDYIRVLQPILKHKYLVELLISDTWYTILDFCITHITRYVEDHESEVPVPSRSFSGLGSGSLLSSGRTTNGSSTISKQVLEDLFSTIVSLVSATNAPLFDRYLEISECTLRFVLLPNPAIGQVFQHALVILSAVIAFARTDHTGFTLNLVTQILPIVSTFLHGHSFSRKDELLSSIRDEMLIILIQSRLHLEKGVQDKESGSLLADLQTLSDVLQADYAKFSSRDQLQFDDLELSDVHSHLHHPFQLPLIRLRAFVSRGENVWAQLQIIGCLERLLSSKSDNRGDKAGDEEVNSEEQPRKRRKKTHTLERYLRPLLLSDEGAKSTHIQAMIFILHEIQFGVDDLREILQQLQACVHDKRGSIASWAFVAIACCSSQQCAPRLGSNEWISTWQTSARALLSRSTCRAASLQMHSLLQHKLIAYHEVAEDISAMILSTDTNGPSGLSDASMTLMSHVLSLRSAEVPGASIQMSQHVLRWLLRCWVPDEKSTATSESTDCGPLQFANVLRQCLGDAPRQLSTLSVVPCGRLAQAWEHHLQTKKLLIYLLLLDHNDNHLQRHPCDICPMESHTDKMTGAMDTTQFQVLRKLAGELFIAKFVRLSASWKMHESGTPIGLEIFAAMFNSVLVALLFFEQCTDKKVQREIEIWGEHVQSTFADMLAYSTNLASLSEVHSIALVTQILQSIQPLLPGCSPDAIRLLLNKSPRLSMALSQVGQYCASASLSTLPTPITIESDMMELDDENSTQASQTQSGETMNNLPRDMISLFKSRSTAYASISGQLVLLNVVSQPAGVSETLPRAFFKHILDLSMENLVYTGTILVEILKSGFLTADSDASKLMKRLLKLLASHTLNRCEVVMVLCLEVLTAFAIHWSQSGTDDAMAQQPLSEDAESLYDYFVHSDPVDEKFTTEVLKRVVNLLMLLIRIKPQYGTVEGMSSPRTKLFAFLGSGSTTIRFHVGDRLHQIFAYFILSDHDTIFIEILRILPSDPSWPEMMAFRMYVLSNLAAKWSNLLRRCIYHIFEIPSKSKGSAFHAQRCFEAVAKELKLKNSREILDLFAPQLLFTWVENESIEDLPYEIFGFSELRTLIEHLKTELVAILSMRALGSQLQQVAELLNLEVVELLKLSFPKVMSYAVSQDAKDTKLGAPASTTIVSSLRETLGQDQYYKLLNMHFPEIVAITFGLLNQSSDVARYFKRSRDLSLAADIHEAIKNLGCSEAPLPPNQQPNFSPKIYSTQISILCALTQFTPSTIYTPALVTYICRKLLDSLHFALGSLHSCMVLRKLRILVALAGQIALTGYPLEMLLHAMQSFLVDPACADDAIGMIKYLLDGGKEHLVKNPSFVAGLGLCYLGRLSLFLRSTQSSTTQESQFKSTMSSAQEFREWFCKYLKRYESPALRSQAKHTFEQLLDSAYAAGFDGKVEIGSPESNLLFNLLRDERKNILLSPLSRKAALSMLSSKFQSPASFRKDIFGRDSLSAVHADVVWKSCHDPAVSKEYLGWAGRVLGRAFAASGQIHNRLSREFRLDNVDEFNTEQDSAAAILQFLQDLTLDVKSRNVGLAEAALRSIMSTVADDPSSSLQSAVSTNLYFASQWKPFQIPPAETYAQGFVANDKIGVLLVDAISKSTWLQDFCLGIAQSSRNYLLGALHPVLQADAGFAETLFPYMLHLSLSTSSDTHEFSRKKLSKAFSGWLQQRRRGSSSNVRILLNSILYLRTQPLDNEKSSADRSQWLDLDYLQAAMAATWCGMPKTALLFAEEISSNQVKSTRRSSTVIETATVPSELLLEIFKNIDDPDMYYGVEQPATLQSILARFDYERDGTKSLAFRGAQYDSHVRQSKQAATSEMFSLVKSLDVLNQSGLSNALLQNQQIIGMTTESVSSMFHTARKLEQWDLPVPTTHQSNQLTIYKAFQAIHNATDRETLSLSLSEGLESTMRGLLGKSLSASTLHETLQTLASLTEADEVTSSRSSVEFEEMIARFDQRSIWMKTGRFEDISPILSTRATILSTLSRADQLRNLSSIQLIDARLVEIRAALLSSKINRGHNALQESLSLATSLIDLIRPCSDLGIHVDVAVHVEAANTLWDQGELSSSIKMLQALDDEESLKQQEIRVERYNLLSQIGYQVSVARLERGDRVTDNYLKPALKELRGKTAGSDAGQVFHQFAVFCDEQLQDADNLADLERLRKLKEDKQAEVEDMKVLIKAATTTVQRSRYTNHMKKAKTWLDIDAAELTRQIATQDEFLQQCLENYLLALTASDDHNPDILRFTALWLEHADDDNCIKAVGKYLKNVPSRKFAPLMNQLSSRLQDNQSAFQNLLYRLVYRICQDHPYHGMYHVYASRRSKADAKDETAKSRGDATAKLAEELKKSPVAPIWQAISATNTGYLNLAAERDDRYKQSSKFKVSESEKAEKLNSLLSRCGIPPPTLNLPLDPTCKYDKVPRMRKLDPNFSIAGGVSAPKILTALGDDGKRYKQLVKGGNDDLRQDAIMEQVFEQVSELLRANKSTRQRNLAIRTYKVLPLSSAAGVIEFVADTIPLHEFLMPAHQKYHPNDWKPQQCRKEISDVQGRSAATRIAKYRQVTEKFNPAMRYYFTEMFPDPDQWFASRLAYTRSTAAISILGHVLGLGDRHGHNILLDNKSGEVVHIDLGVAFESGRVLPVPELVPFRLTRDIVDGMGITKTEGVFRRCCEFTLEALRKEVYSIMTILDVLRFDPLYNWSMSPVRLAKFQQEQDNASVAPTDDVAEKKERMTTSVNEPGEADRALTVVNKKLSKTLSVTATVNDLINQASDEKNLAVLFSGWAAYA